ncbi:MAG: HAD family hydrolase [Anaerolineales bacterium]
MIELNIPGFGQFQIEHLVCDLNGTLAQDGKLLEGIPRILRTLRDRLTVHVLTADTRGNHQIIELQLGMPVSLIQRGNEDQQKADYIMRLDPQKVIAIGQGQNDTQMLKNAAIGICVLSNEGTSISALNAADILAKDIYQALELIEKPLRLVATLRK